MRIAVNTRFLLPKGLEGLGVYTREISHRLVALLPEHEWHFLYDRAIDPSFQIDGAQHHCLWPPARHPLLWYLWFEQAVPRKLRKIKADLFFSPDGYASLSTKVPQLVTIHDLAYEYYPDAIPAFVNQYYRYFTPKFCRAASRIIAVSENTASDLKNLYRIDATKIDVVSNGYSDEFRPIAAETKWQVQQKYCGGKPYYIYVGAIHPRKNVLNLLKAFELFANSYPEMTQMLALVGRKAWGNEDLNTYCQKMVQKERVIWIDHLERKEIALLMAGSEAMLYPSYYEGFGLPVLEAMACGVPSVTTKGSPMESFAQGSCLAVNPEDLDAISQAMHRLACEEKYRYELGRRALESSKNLSWDKAAENIAEIIEKHFANKNLL
jgi:glycosyltransferase involved in cell wall biosynthesis